MPLVSQKIPWHKVPRALSKRNRINFVRANSKIRIELLKSGWFFELLDIHNLLFGVNFIERFKDEENCHSTLILKQPPEVFYKKVVLKNFVKFTGKHLSQSLFLNRVAGLRPAALQY